MSITSDTRYTVQAGDTLFTIAQKLLGNGNLYPEIRNADGTTPNPAQLHPGQVLFVPGATDHRSHSAPAHASHSAPAHASHSAPAHASHSAPPHASQGAPASGGSGFAGILSQQNYQAMFPNRNALYTYDGLIGATRAFPRFCNEGSLPQNRREAAAFLANISHETGALVFAEEQNPPIIYCDASNTSHPCARGKTYHGRGPLQLSWNYNYGACGSAIGKDLLNHPELVSTNSTITFMTALWFWMTAQPPKPSCHDAIRSSGFGMTINVINGGIECGKGAPTPQAQHRIQLYRTYCGMLGVDPGGNLEC